MHNLSSPVLKFCAIFSWSQILHIDMGQTVRGNSKKSCHTSTPSIIHSEVKEWCHYNDVWSGVPMYWRLDLVPPVSEGGDVGVPFSFSMF